MRLPSDGRDILRDLSIQRYNLDTPDALLLAGVVPGGDRGQLARVSADGILQVDVRTPRTDRAWEPWDMRCKTGLDETGQDTFHRFVAKGTTIYYAEPQMCEGCEDLSIVVMVGAQNTGAALNPYVEFRVFLSEDPDAYAALSIATKTWTALASATKAPAWAFSLNNTITTSNGDARGVMPVMFDFLVRADNANANALVPFTVRVVGR